MKLITAIVQPEKLEDVQVALAQYGIRGMTISEASGYAHQGHSEVYRGDTYTIDFIGKIRVEVLVKDAESAEVVQLICDNARTGSIGDGKVWIVHLEDVVRIRTGESGGDAL